MPKLTYFVACEKILISEEEKTASLISLLEKINLSPPPPSAEKPQAAMRWAIVSLWKKLNEDEGKRFEQRTYVVAPDGTETAEIIIEFGFDGETKNQRNVINVGGFPISPEGEYFVKLSIREVGAPNWNDAGEYPIIVAYIN